MSKEWPYAKLSKMAKAAGGPEKLLEKIKIQENLKGAIAERKKLAPLLVILPGLGVLGKLGYQKLHSWISEQNRKKQAIEVEAQAAEAILLNELHGLYDQVDDTENVMEEAQNETVEAGI